MVLDAVTNKAIYSSALRLRTPKDPNKRLVDAGGGGGGEIINLTKHPLNIQPQSQMGRSPLHQTLLLSISNQGMMMVQPQTSLWQDSTLMTLLEGPFYYLQETMGETKGKSHQKNG